MTDLEQVIFRKFLEDLRRHGIEPDKDFVAPSGKRTVAGWLKSVTEFVPDINYSEFVKFEPTSNPLCPWVVYLKF